MNKIRLVTLLMIVILLTVLGIGMANASTKGNDAYAAPVSGRTFSNIVEKSTNNNDETASDPYDPYAVLSQAQEAPDGKYALSMVEAYQFALKKAKTWDESARLYAMTSVDEDRPAQYDGTTGRLPHWNIDFVGSNDALYHIELRDGKITLAEVQGRALYKDGLPPETALVDSPMLAPLLLDKGWEPYRGKWGHGLNFVFTSQNGKHQIIVRCASQEGLPAFVTFDAHDGTLLTATERSITGGGVYRLSIQESLGIVKRILPPQGSVANNITTIATVQDATVNNKPVIYAGTDTRRDALFSEQAQLLVSHDGGMTWHALEGPFSKTDAILHVQATPNNSALFVGTTDGLFFTQKTDNAPISWHTPQQQGLPKGHVTSLMLSPAFHEDQTVWVSIGKPTIASSLWAIPGSEGLFRSTDGGGTWQRVISAPGNINDIVVSPNYPSDHTLFVVSDRAGIFRSSDDGNTWIRLPLQESALNQIAISPNFAIDHTLFAASMNGLWRSDDGGEQWNLLTKGMSYPQNAAINVYLSPFYGRDQTVVYGAFRGGLMISQDGGKTWKHIDLMNTGDPTPRAMTFLEEKTLLFSTYPLLDWKPIDK